MYLYNNEFYMEDIDIVCNADLPWNKLQGKSILISGATGLIGSFFIDVLMRKNENGLNCTIYILSRSSQNAANRFSRWAESSYLSLITYDVNIPFFGNDIGNIDYVIHMASNTHPVQYSTDPIGTIFTNVIGTKHMLDLAIEHHATRFVFTSSNEIYGENRGDKEFFDEDYCGYINSNTVRAGYPESKRCGEALCRAYQSQKGLDVVIPRLTRSYGPTMQMSDTKAISQFIKKGIVGEDIVLKSDGTQYYSYTYVADAVKGILFVLLKGEAGEAYNIADEMSDIMLKDLAAIVAQDSGTKVVFQIPDAVEAAGYSKATKARLDGRKLKKLGWYPKYDISSGVKRTLKIMRIQKKE